MHLCKLVAASRAKVLKVSLISLFTGAVMNKMQFKFLSYLPFESESGEPNGELNLSDNHRILAAALR